MEAECAAAEQVGAGFSDDVDLTTCAAAIFGAIAVRGEPELANRLHSQRSPRRAAGRAVRKVVLEGAVEQIDVGARALAVDAHREPMRHHRTVVAVRKGIHGRLQLHQVRIVAAIDGNLFDRPLIGEVREVARLRAHSGGAADGHLLRRSDLQRQVRRAPANVRRRLSAAAPKRLEGCAHLVLAGRQRRRTNRLPIGNQFARRACADVPDLTVTLAVCP